MDIKKELKRELDFAPEIKNILNKNIQNIMNHSFGLFEFEKSSVEEDTKEGFDFLLKGGDIKIPVRIRKPDCKFRDFTIRWESRFNRKTEIDKLNEGAGDVYFYAWTKSEDKISDWVLINLHELRESTNLSRENETLISRVKRNGDGTCFSFLKISELKKALINGTPNILKMNKEIKSKNIIESGKQFKINFFNH